jgi:hypothetical protein
LRPIRTRDPSDSTFLPTRVGSLVSGSSSITLLAWIDASRSMIPPLMFFCGFGRVCRLIMFTPSTTTRLRPGTTASTRPFLPRSLPARIIT